MTGEKRLFCSFYILSGCQRNQNMSRISEQDIQSKAGLAGHRKTHHPGLQRKNPTDSYFIVK